MDKGFNVTTSRGIPWSDDDITWSTTEEPFSPEEEDAIVTIVVVVICVTIAIIALFCMGVFMDCRDQKSDHPKRRHPLSLKMPPIGRRRNRDQKYGDEKSLATDMCPSGASNPGPSNIDAIV